MDKHDMPSLHAGCQMEYMHSGLPDEHSVPCNRNLELDGSFFRGKK